jgi:hypothetical protein
MSMPRILARMPLDWRMICPAAAFAVRRGLLEDLLRLDEPTSATVTLA